ncbi:hypothetical protein C8A05DRAFT_17411 [Staphylotrichum tortipilum]|uniref:DUF1746 domain-containing protein n=1 Tax=Staphylotrichum tortipilum TaxID=2831512 RepID=A0AAN6RS86_9PEZI|nr:hypothetical protein C8A05DRAFT_17411 [Staphylotrichum longicolle]
MNHDDPGPSYAARQPPPPPPSDREDDAAGASASSGTSNSGGSSQVGEEGPDTSPGSPQPERERRREGLAKKLEFVSHLQKTLDMIVVVYICTIYSMECSFIRLLLRLLPHYFFLTPKDGMLLPAEQPHIYTIFLPGTLCILAHLFLALPHAGEASRGYLHGGVLIDFIGQRPPTSRLAFLLFDLVVLGAQCLMLAVHQERERLKKAVTPGLPTISASVAQAREDAAAAAAEASGTVQDHDAEERGVLRRGETEGQENEGGGDGIELQPLAGSGSGGTTTPADEDDERAAGTYSSAAASADMLDVMRSGNAVLGHFHVVHAVRTVANGAQTAAAYSLRTLGYGATIAAIQAERRSRLVRGQR